MTADEINALPIQRYGGCIHVIRTRSEARDAIELLAGEEILGFDTETKPTYRKGERNNPAVIQLACAEAVYLFQLRHVQFPRPLRRLLSDPNIIKAGVALSRDIAELQELGGFKPAGFVDLGDMAREKGLKNHGLRGLAAAMLGFRISKRAQRSNWSRRELTPEQIAYAATDAWCGRELYLCFRNNGFVEHVPVCDPQPKASPLPERPDR